MPWFPSPVPAWDSMKDPLAIPIGKIPCLSFADGELMMES